MVWEGRSRAYPSATATVNTVPVCPDGAGAEAGCVQGEGDGSDGLHVRPVAASHPVGGLLHEAGDGHWGGLDGAPVLVDLAVGGVGGGDGDGVHPEVGEVVHV